MSIINLVTDIEAMEEFEPLPQGRYTAEIREVEVRTSEKLPDGYFHISMLINTDQFPADYDEANQPEGALITYSRVAVPTAEKRRTVKPFKNLLRCLGVEVNGTEFDPQTWVSKEVQVLLKVDEYQGTPTNQVEALMATVDA